MLRLVLALVCAFIASLAIGPIIIPWLKKLKFGQNVRVFGPSAHLKKQGVPTMGGIMICAVLIVCALVFSFAQGRVSIMVPAVVFTALCALIGFIDDYIKVVKKRSLGLRARDKTWMLLLISAGFALYCYFNPDIGSVLYLPFTSVTWDLGKWYVPFAMLVIYATVNSANLLDGADGLLSSVTLVMMSFAALICYFALEMGRSEPIYGNMMVLSAAGAGACLGFLLFNRFPAKVFMGDTGSFALGGAFVAIALTMRMPLWLLIVGIMYVLTALSDILQALSYKLLHKPMFRMAPLHHHLEMGGMKERAIVRLYTLISIAAGLIGLWAAL